MNLRVKFLLGSAVLTLVISVSLSISSYSVLRNELYKEYRDRLENTTEIGARTITQENLKNLIKKINQELTKDELKKIYNSEEYIQISEDLNEIRNSKKELIRYAYIWYKTQDKNKVIFIADADVLTLSKEEAFFSSEEVSHFGSLYDISNFKEAKKTFELDKTHTETDYFYDKEFNAYSVSCYTPIFDKNTKEVIAVLGIDMTDTNIRNALRKASLISTIIGIVTILFASVASLLLGNLFVKPILELNNVVIQFGEKDFSVRGKVKSSDEVGMLTNNFNNMAETIVEYDSKIKEMLDAMKKFVPFEFLNYLQKEDITQIELGDQVDREMTIFFSDIRSFTKLSETMTPRETFRFINGYLKRMGPLIRKNQGFIDKYIGDAIMAIFAVNPDYAINAALDILEELRSYNQERIHYGLKSIEAGIGIHTGNLMLGTIGEQERMDTTVIADSVNLASRLEGLTKHYGVSLIISETTKEKLLNPENFSFRFLGLVQVVGKNTPVGIYEVYLKLVNPKLDEIKNDFELALDLYLKAKLKESFESFKKVYKLYPDDKPTIYYLKRIKNYLKIGLPNNWNGVEKIGTK